MEALVWNPELDTGIAEIDRQHRRIVDYINKLHALGTSGDREAVGMVVAELVDYTISHFIYEEALMEQAGYVFLGPHKKVHEIFTRRVADIQARFNDGEDVVEELYTLLSRWLFNHIRDEDRSYVASARAYLRKMRNSPTSDMPLEQELHRIKRSWLSRLFGK